MPRTEASAAVSVERFFQFALLGLMASGLLALAGSGYLETPVIVWTVAGLALRSLTIRGPLRLEFSDRAITLITALYLGFFLVDYFLISKEALPATVHLVFFLAVVKTLMAKTTRDYLVVSLIAFLQLLAAAMLSMGLNFVVSLALYLMFAIAALAGAEMRRSINKAGATSRGGLRGFHPRLAVLAAAVTGGILALTAGLFFVLPRTAGAALSRLSRRGAMLGFTRQVRLGQIGELKTSSQPVMHVRFVGGAVPEDLKWRGAALADFDGRNWSNQAPRSTRVRFENGSADLEADLQTASRHLDYRVEFDSFDDNTLFFPGSPEKIEMAGAALLRDELGNYTLEQRPERSFHYDGYSSLPGPPETAPPRSPAPILRLESRELYVQLPERLDPRIPELARSLTAGAATDLERARAVEEHLRNGYAYSLRLSSRPSTDPLADFLFVRRQGHCEYFASAMAVLLRSLSIPARLATGFQSGEYNPYTGLWVIRASDAHSWVEAWIPGYGWSAFDPTPYAAAEFPLTRSVSLYLDAAQTLWQEWIVGFDVTRQGLLANRLEHNVLSAGMRWYEVISSARLNWRRSYGARGRDALRSGAALLGGILLAGALAIWWLRRRRARRGQPHMSRARAGSVDATLLYSRMLRILKRRGFQKPPWFTPGEFAASLPRGAMGVSVTEFTAAYNAWRFGGRTEVAPRLSALLDELERQS
jgi:protein-glutamine gamma-glutamyltransferase